MTDELREYDFLLESEHPEAVLALLHHLSYLRSAALLGRRLAEKYPTQEAWLSVMRSAEFIELLEEFAACVSDVRTAAELGPTWNPEKVQEVVRAHYTRALDAVHAFAELVEVPGDEVIAALIQA